MKAFTSGFSIKALAQALANRDIKPSLTPNFSTNFSCTSLRSFITLVRSTSLKVVSMAVSFFAFVKRAAMVRRMRLIFFRDSSRLKSALGVAGAGALASFFSAAGALGAAACAFSASALVMRPSRPVPCTSAGLIFFSAKILLAAGLGCPLA